MKRTFLLLFVLAVPLGACNPEGPTGPEPYFWADVLGLWKMRMEEDGCAPDDILNLQVSRFGAGIEGDSVLVGGAWFRDEVNPQSFSLRGHYGVTTGEAHLRLDQHATMRIDGFFISSRDFRGAFIDDTKPCAVRVRGRFIE